MSNGEKRSPRNGTVKARGSSVKQPGGTKPRGTAKRGGDAPPRRNGKTWRTASVAYDERGNIVVLDEGLARKLRGQAQRDAVIDVALPDRPDKIGSLPIVLPPAVPPKQPAPLPNQLCQCGDLLRLRINRRKMRTSDVLRAPSVIP